MKTEILLVFSLLLVAPGRAEAQTTTRPVLTREGARRVADEALGEARRREATGAIAVVDDGGHLLTFDRIDGTFAASAEVSIGKAKTAALFKKPTSFFEDIITRKGRTSMIALPDFTPLQGGVPIVIAGEVVGAIGVSGARSAQDDDEIATLAAATFDRKPLASNAAVAPSPVTFVAGVKVRDAFQKGMPLVEMPGYKVHASRREKPGEAEVHSDDTDVIYVQSGKATVVTGGTIVDPKQTAEGEHRGASISGGEFRELAPGDVLIVPNGVPHWFQRVEGPLVYYVVKVTSTVACGGHE